MEKKKSPSKRKLNQPKLDLLQIAQDNLEGLKKRAGYLDNWFFVLENGSTDFRVSQACYANVAHLTHAFKPVYFVIWHPQNGLKKHKEEEFNYFNWLFNDSPFSKVFVSKDASKVSEEPTILLCNVLPQFMICAAIAVRYRHEKPAMILLWDKLVKHGMDKRLAWIICQCGCDQKTYFRRTFDTGHQAFDSCLTPDVIAGFMSGEANHNPDNLKTVEEGNYKYRRICRIWGKDTGDDRASEPKWPDIKDILVKGAFGEQKVNGYPFENILAFQTEFLKLNGAKL